MARTAEQLKTKIVDTYEGRDIYREGAWKLESDQIITPEVIDRIYDHLRSYRILPAPHLPLTFVSPTANIPTHELSFFNKDSETRTAESLFLVGDISSLPLEPTQKQEQRGNKTLQYFRWDAHELPLSPQSVDIIWDRKGWLWHILSEKNEVLMIETMKNYFELLRPNGAIVIDSIQDFERKMRDFYKKKGLSRALYVLIRASGAKVNLLPKITPSMVVPLKETLQGEDSTNELLRQRMQDCKSFAQLINENFTIESLGWKEHEIVVLQRRTAEWRGSD
jgi:hypothetical protein